MGGPKDGSRFKDTKATLQMGVALTTPRLHHRWDLLQRHQGYTTDGSRFNDTTTPGSSPGFISKQLEISFPYQYFVAQTLSCKT